MLKDLVWRLRGCLTLRELKRRGLTIGNDCHILERVILDPSHCGHISIGNRVTIAPEAYVLAHDASTQRKFGYTYIANVTIEDDVFIGVRALIMPGVRIGKGSIVGAGSVVTKDVLPGTIVAGNPAKVVGSIEAFFEKHQQQMGRLPLFEEGYTQRAGVTQKMVQDMNAQMKTGKGYIR